MAQVDRKHEKLHQGPNTEKARRKAQRKLDVLLKIRYAEADLDDQRYTVTSIIELYLSHAKKRYSDRSYYERHLILQSFAETHGWRKVNDRECLPFHLTS